MAKVVNLAAFRDRRARAGIRARPPDRSSGGQVAIDLQDDGTHQFVLRGAYAESIDLAVEAMAEAILYLMEVRRASGAPEK